LTLSIRSSPSWVLPITWQMWRQQSDDTPLSLAVPYLLFTCVTSCTVPISQTTLFLNYKD
jgi:hypothetical protein